MPQRLALTALLVAEYDPAIAFFTTALGWDLAEDVAQGGEKRWVVVAPAGGSGLLLARAADDGQRAMIGKQGGGRVFLFLETDDFHRDHARMTAAGVRFLETPRREVYGTVAVFEDISGNRWDLIERA
ncbi:Glyoxalase/fosfomycin resistance/dioxygenase domain containing protein [Caulobacteraceae bacterium]